MSLVLLREFLQRLQVHSAYGRKNDDGDRRTFASRASSIVQLNDRRQGSFRRQQPWCP
jgi:hypothetical protein